MNVNSYSTERHIKKWNNERENGSYNSTNYLKNRKQNFSGKEEMQDEL